MRAPLQLAILRWREPVDGELPPLDLTIVKPGQGRAGMQHWPLCGYETPACSEHGAMNRVAEKAQLWRCPTCNVGGEWHKEVTSSVIP